MLISLSTARRLALSSQGLDGGWDLPPGKEGVAQAIEHLGYVQIDTISVVERAHHHILWTRCPDYAPAMLDELLTRDRRVFEYWAHAAAYIPLRDYRYYLPRMQAYATGARTHLWLEQNADVVHTVKERIREEGPLASADFDAPEGWVRGTWWNWKPAKRALETLFATGELMVCARRGFQRVYDLTERVLPPSTDLTMPTEVELALYAVRRYLGAQGIATSRDLRRDVAGAAAIAAALRNLVARGEVTPVEIEGLSGTTSATSHTGAKEQADGLGTEAHFVLTRLLEPAEHQPSRTLRLHILSPFDNLIIWRDRLLRLFGFDYSIECYLPAEKRRFGYFSLPILWGERFVGRLDAKADRKAKTLIVRSILFEPGVGLEELLPALASRLHDYAAFNGCVRVVVERTVPEVHLTL